MLHSLKYCLKSRDSRRSLFFMRRFFIYSW